LSPLAATLLLVLAAGEAPVLVPAAVAAALPAASAAATPALTLPRSGGLGLGALAAPAVLLAGLGVALFLARRKARPGRLVQVLETTSLGPKRSLVLARLGDEVLLLGSSEAGITLLRSQAAAPAREGAAVTEPEPESTGRSRFLSAVRAEPPAALAGLVSRLRRTRAPAASPGFESLLTESAEDQDLRRKLARGQSGSVR
jgi:flagellar biogenesis protein FliO